MESRLGYDNNIKKTSHSGHYSMFNTRHGNITFENHLENMKDPIKAIIVDLRNFVISLGSNVIEEVRPHRIVYSKTLNFRIFLEIEPTDGESLKLSIRHGRSIPPSSLMVMTLEDAAGAKKQIAEAYHKTQ
jgi:hypothetical protein